MAERSDQALDALDRALILALAEHPRVSILELARLLGVARNTVYARLERLQDRAVITGFGPDIDLRTLGYEVTAFITVVVAQVGFTDVVERLARIPHIVEVHTIAGPGDLHCRVVAASNAGIMEIVEQILRIPGVDRTATAISLAEQIGYRPLGLLAD
ncbi:MAG TPA: Lrp/AsnC family transcriptional regulator [Acidimicrobiia bacterium]|jgi:DNA-binding Lrp family transcriptional regulator|nr:Lrp/AsnC family transcriptional regulator [Acidimicrobiia bacterium]